jgi:hypothetical protein
MMIGTSLGKCIKDILDGVVKEDDVFFIVANTRCPTIDRLLQVVEDYYFAPPTKAYDITAYSLEDAKSLAKRLYMSGKIHQPRCFGGLINNGHNGKDNWLEVVPTITSHNESVVNAYAKYRMIAALAS